MSAALRRDRAADQPFLGRARWHERAVDPRLGAVRAKVLRLPLQYCWENIYVAQLGLEKSAFVTLLPVQREAPQDGVDTE